VDEKPQHIDASQSDIDKGANKLTGSFGVETIILYNYQAASGTV